MSDALLDSREKRALAKLRCEEDHLFFSRYFFKARQGIKFRVNWHHRLISDVIEDIIHGRKKNVVITVSPGSSKTEIVVINFIARGLALNPRARFLHLSGSDSLASLNSATAREIIKSDEYQALWPLQIAEDANAKKRWNVLVDGQPAGGVYATSLGGQITGFRAGHMTEGFQGCFVGDTLVQTKQGAKPIDAIAPGDLVASFNHDTGATEFQPVLAVKESLRDDIVEVKTKAGRHARCTPCHRFYDGKTYRPISEFAPGEQLRVISRIGLAQMPPLPESISTASRGNEKSDASWAVVNFLFRKMLFIRCEANRTTFKARETLVSCLHQVISTYFSFEPNMFVRMQQSFALTTNEGEGKPQFPSWERVPKTIQEAKTSDSRARYSLSRMLIDFWFGGSPRGWKQTEQPSREFSNDVPFVPHGTSQVTQDTVCSVARISCCPTKVYDIQVAKNHNFFAEGILVHNCILIDDPIKPEDAFSRIKLDAANRKLLTTVKSRKANPSTPIVIVMQRIAESDPVGFIAGGSLEGPWDFVKIPALIDRAYTEDLAPAYKDLVTMTPTDAHGRFSYWPYKEPLDSLLAMERGDGADQNGGRISRHVFTSQYQQDPVALGGNIIRGEYFERYKVLPKIKFRKIFADTAQKTKEHNDFSVFEEWGAGTDGKLYLLDLIRGKWEAPELQRRAISFWSKANNRDSENFGQLRKMVVEDKSSGTGLVQTIKLLNNIPIEPIERIKDKLTRVMDALPYLEAHQVAVPEDAPYTNDFIAENESFTADDSHDFDDQIDPMVDAISDMLASGNKIRQWEQLAQ